MNAQEGFQFNVLDEPWLHCLIPQGGHNGATRRQDLGLRDALYRAHDIVEIVDPSPLITIAVHRLLLAVLHRVYGPKDKDTWTTLWEQGRFDSARLDGYLSRPDIYPRFDLFDAERPFYQVGAIDPEYGGPIAKLTHEQASTGNATLLFDHAGGAAAHGLTPAQAAAYLLACQAFAVGGLISYEKGQDPKIYKSAAAAPLVKSAVTLVRGQTLFETLLLNLNRYDPAQQARASSSGGDLPAWERAAPPDAERRYPTGYLDLLTWQARRIRLFPERDEQGRVVVRRAAIMKGHPFPDNYERRNDEPMVAFTHNDKATAGQDANPPLGFREERALWRDSLTLFQTAAKARQRPATLDWLDRVGVKRQLRRKALPLDAFGMRSDQAKVLAWRHERLLLPLAYLDQENDDLFQSLGTALQLAEETARAVRDSARKLAQMLIAVDSDHAGARVPQKGDVNALASSLGIERIYWSRLEEPFKKLLVDLPDIDDETGDEAEDEDAFDRHARVVLDGWADTLRATAREAFDTAVNGLDTSARTLKAAALARRAHHSYVAKALGVYGRRRDQNDERHSGGEAAATDNQHVGVAL